MDDTKVKAILDDEVSLDSLDEEEHRDKVVETPAMHDESSASGHAPELEADDDIDDMGQDLGVTYTEDEELDINSKVPVVTESEPPAEDTPY